VKPDPGAACWAAPALRLGSTRLVPVLHARAHALRSGVRPICSGWAEARLVGVWVAPASGKPGFLPGQATPPGAAEDWNAWLLSEPALLDGIAERLRASG
jgi:hypothetical protein